MYCSGCWSYTVGAITTPVFIAIPFLTIRIGELPGCVLTWHCTVLNHSLPHHLDRCAALLYSNMELHGLTAHSLDRQRHRLGIAVPLIWRHHMQCT